MKIFVPAMGRVNTRNRDGSEVRFAEMAKEWIERGEELHILLPEREVDVLSQQGVRGAALHVLKEPVRLQSDSLANVLAVYAVRMVQSFFVKYPVPVDVIYAPSDFLVDTIPAFLCRLRNKQARLFVCVFLLAPHPLKGYQGVYASGIRLPSARGLLFYLTQRIAIGLTRKLGGKLFVLNSMDRQGLIEKGVPAAEVYVVPMGVRVEEFARTSPGNPGAFDGIFLGRLHPQKGVFDLIEVWSKVCASRPESRLAVVGGGGEWWSDELRRRARAAGLNGNIEILGFKAGEEKIKLLKSAKFLLMPSYYESWGMVAIEAMTCGLPVVAYDLPVFREIFPQGMVRVPIGDTNAMADAVLALMTRPEQAERLAREAVSHARKHDWGAIADAELQVLAGQS